MRWKSDGSMRTAPSGSWSPLSHAFAASVPRFTTPSFFLYRTHLSKTSLYWTFLVFLVSSTCFGKKIIQITYTCIYWVIILKMQVQLKIYQSCYCSRFLCTYVWHTYIHTYTYVCMHLPMKEIKEKDLEGEKKGSG